jgi:hypothetical protein
MSASVDWQRPNTVGAANGTRKLRGLVYVAAESAEFGQWLQWCRGAESGRCLAPSTFCWPLS